MKPAARIRNNAGFISAPPVKEFGSRATFQALFKVTATGQGSGISAAAVLGAESP
jgi:hypothetical protein